MSATPPTRLDTFNDQPPDRAVAALRACNSAPRFAAELVAGRPYRDVDTLVTRAEQVARALPWEEVALALAAHPRIGDRVDGTSSEAQASRREQGSMAGADDATRAALVDGNRAYEERFDRVFIIRAAGRSGQDVLGELARRLGNTPGAERAELRRRLGNDEETERRETTEQLAQISALRVKGLVS